MSHDIWGEFGCSSTDINLSEQVWRLANAIEELNKKDREEVQSILRALENTTQIMSDQAEELKMLKGGDDE